MVECKEHGRIRGRKDVKYCPVCGKEVIPISLFPLAKVYIWKNDLFKTALLVCAVMLVLIVVRAKRENGTVGRLAEAEKSRALEQMSPEWQFVYRSAQKMTTFDRQRFLRRYAEENGDRLSKPGLNQAQVELFLDLMPMHEVDETAPLLGRFLRLDRPEPSAADVEGG